MKIVIPTMVIGIVAVASAFVTTIPSYLEPVFSSYKLTKELGIKAGVDRSHNHHHAMEVLFWACDIMRQNLDTLHHPREIQMIAQCSLLHDTIDEKYTDFSPQVRNHLQEWYEEKETDMLMRIMKDMSYSKVMEHGFPHWCLEHDLSWNYTMIYHVVREADLLSSYNLARMIEYRKYNKKMMIKNYTDTMIRKEMVDLYEIRMGKLIPNGLFVHPSSRERASQLDAIARLRLLLLPSLDITTSSQLDILRNIDHLNIFTLILMLNDISTPIMKKKMI